MWRAWGLVQGPPGSGSWSQDSIPVSLTSESGGSCVLPAQPAVLMERPMLSIRWRKTSAVLKGGLATPLVQQDEPELLLGPLPHAHLHMASNFKSIPWDFLLFLMSLGFLPSSQTPFWSCSVFFPHLNLLPASLPSYFSPHYSHRCCRSKVRPLRAALPVPHGRALRVLYVHACYVASVLSDSLWCQGCLGSSVHGILQARILEWAAVPSSRGSSWPRDWIRFSYVTWIRQMGSLPLAPPEKDHPVYWTCHPNFTV